MKNFEVTKCAINVFTGIAACCACLAGLLTLGWFMFFFAPVAILVFMFYVASGVFHFCRAAKSCQSHNALFLSLTLVFDSIFLLWFFESFGGISKCLEIFHSSTKQIEYYESILFLNYVIWIVVSLIAEAIYAFIKNVNVKSDFSTNGVINKAIGFLGIASIIFTGLVSSYYYGFTIYNYIFLAVLIPMAVVLLLNIVTKSRKARIDFTVIMCLFLAFYFPVFAHVYRIMSGDGITVLLLTGFICSGIVIPAVTVSNIIYLINTSDKNKEKVHIVC